MSAPLETNAPSFGARFDKMAAQLDYLVARQQAVDELLEELAPIARLAMTGAVETLDELDKAGWFAMARELARVGDRVVRSYTPEDVRRLGDQIVAILDTVRNLTQPDVLAMVNDVTDAVHEADEADPKGMWGLARAGRDPEVKKGIGVLIAILKHVGRAADTLGKTAAAPPSVRVAAAESGTPSWMRHLAPRRGRPTEAPAVPRVVRPVAAQEPTATSKPAAPMIDLPPGYKADGFIADPTTWTRELAERVASLVPIVLTEGHWTILSWARADFLEHGASPNVRRLSLGAGVPMRDLYNLFPGRPGVLVAMLAGIPKPAGCL